MTNEPIFDKITSDLIKGDILYEEVGRIRT